MKNVQMKTIFVILLVGLLASCNKSKSMKENTVHIPVTAKVKGMDPIFSNDRYSGNEVMRVYEGLLEYHYLKRPFTLQPNLAAALPEVSNNGLTYTFKLKQGVKFHDNACFPGGKGRELVAEDIVYSIKRTAGDAKALGWWVIDGKLKGLNEWRDKVTAPGATVDFSEVVEGVKALDKYTVQFNLTKPFPQFLYALAMPFFVAVPKEAVDHYGEEFLNHPVGTGPFTLDKFDRTNRIVYKKNPNFRDKFYPSEGMPGDKEKGLLDDAGKKLPLADKLVIQIMVEDQPRWLKFQKGELDFLFIPKDNFDSAVTPEGLTPDMAAKGIKLQIVPDLDVTYTAFQHTNPLFDNVNLRRAMSLAYDPATANTLFYSGTAIPAQSLVPPGIAGNIPGFKNEWVGPDIERAKKLLAEAGYPEGKGLPEITFDTSASSVSRQIGEFFARQMAKIGVKIKVITNPWPELQKKIQTRQTMLQSLAWGADYPDAENFLQLLYGPNKTPGANGSNYDNPEFNKMFDKARYLQDSPERTKLYEEMNKWAADQVPWIYGVHRQRYTLIQGWLRNYQYMPIDHGMEKYFRIDLDAKAKLLKEKF